MVNDRFGDWVMRVIKRMDFIFSVTTVHFKTYLFTYFYSGHYGIGMVSKRMYFKVHFQVIHWHYTMGHVLNQKGCEKNAISDSQKTTSNCEIFGQF